MKKMPQGEELKKLANKLGVSTHSSATQAGTDDSILQDRCLRFLELKRSTSFWIVAVISSFASIASALAAWYAIAESTPLH